MNHSERDTSSAHDSVSLAVVEEVAEQEAVPMEQLPPLNKILDPDALDTLASSLSNSSNKVNWEITFTYSGHRVMVRENMVATLEHN